MPYNYEPLARRYARYLPVHAASDWEDILQEMELASLAHPGQNTRQWAAAKMVRAEHMICRPMELDWWDQREPRLDQICEAYRFVVQAPWLLGLMIEGSAEALAKRLGLSHGTIRKRLNSLRARLGVRAKWKK